MPESILQSLGKVPEILIEFAPKVFLALAIMIIGRFVVGRILRAVEAAMNKFPNIDKTLSGFFISTIYFACMALLVVGAFSALSIDMGFFGTMLSALIIALGFALQGALGDLASGILLIFFRPYKVGQEVELNGTNGVVTNLGLFATKMKTRENVEIFIGNGDAFNNTIKNYYAFGTRRMVRTFGVSYDANLDDAIKAILTSVEGDKRILPEPAPWAKVVSLGDSSVNIQLRVWCDPDEYRHIEMDLSYRVKQALDAAEIEIPFPHSSIIKKEA